MLTEKKLLSLKERTRKRKISMILSQIAHSMKTGSTPDWSYVNMVLTLAGFPVVNAEADSLRHVMFVLEDRANELLVQLGSEPSDWDFTDSAGQLDISKRVVEDKILVLDRLRSPFNVGAVFRSADSFGIKKIILVEGTASPEHVRARRTSRGCTETVDWVFMTEEEVAGFLSSYMEAGKGEADVGEGCVAEQGIERGIIALETGGEDINTYDFPFSGVGVLGSEEFGISPQILRCCTARVSIPMGGTKGSLNVSVAGGIFLQRWFNSTSQK